MRLMKSIIAGGFVAVGFVLVACVGNDVTASVVNVDSPEAATADSPMGADSAPSAFDAAPDAVADTSAPADAKREAAACGLTVPKGNGVVHCPNVLSGSEPNCDVQANQACCFTGSFRECVATTDPACATTGWSCEDQASCPGARCCANLTGFGATLDACAETTATHSECHATCTNSIELCDPSANVPCSAGKTCVAVHVNITAPNTTNLLTVGACVAF